MHLGKQSRWSTMFYLCVTGAISLFGAVGARAAAADDELHLDLNLGLWATSATGTTGVGPFEADINANFSDLVDHLNFGAMGGAELSKGNWFLAFNGMYTRLEGSGSGAIGDIDITSNMGIADLALGYTLVRTDIGSVPLQLAPVVGARYTYLDLEVDPDILPSRSKGRGWVDPYVGARAVLGLSDRVNWRIEGTVGGFGVGSDFAWAAATYIDWQFAEAWTLNVGYRALSWDYDHDNLKWDVTFYGPWLGLTWRAF